MVRMLVVSLRVGEHIAIIEFVGMVITVMEMIACFRELSGRGLAAGKKVY
jgi:hypothetical protein